MKRLILGVGVVAAMLMVSSSAFAAAGVRLAWTKCWGEDSTVSAVNKSFACNSNVGSNLLVCSFVLGAPVQQVSGNELVLDILTNTLALPAWWDLKNVGACRVTALGFNITADPNNLICQDWAQGQSSGGIGAYSSEAGSVGVGSQAAHRRIKIALAVPQTGLQDLLADVEYFSCNVTVNNTKSVGTGLCDGCADKACIVFNSIKVTTPTPSNDVIIGDNTFTQNIVTWQGTGLDCQLVPTRNTTWSAVKALYR